MRQMILMQYYLSPREGGGSKPLPSPEGRRLLPADEAPRGVHRDRRPTAAEVRSGRV